MCNNGLIHLYESIIFGKWVERAVLSEMKTEERTAAIKKEGSAQSSGEPKCLSVYPCKANDTAICQLSGFICHVASGILMRKSEGPNISVLCSGNFKLCSSSS